MADWHFAKGTLTELLPEWTRPHHRIQLVYRASRNLHAKVRTFADRAAELFSSVDANG